MHSDFVNISKNMSNESLLKTETLFVTKKKSWFEAFASHFQSICADIVKLQNESTLPAISYMEYSLLYTNFINRKYIAEVLVYGDRRYLDKKQRIIGEYDISFLFIYFDELWNELLSTRKRYLGKVTASEIKSIMLKSLPFFYSYLVSIARFAIKDCINKKPFVDINKNDLFRVKVGDYMANAEIIYSESKYKDATTLAKWFLEKLENEYTFEDFSDLDFSGYTFDSTEFCFSQFRGSNLNSVSLESSVLIGANFCMASMENCCLENCSINEADFSFALLRNASFYNSNGQAGLANRAKWQRVRFLPVNFSYADLTNVDFRWSKLQEADFTGSILSGASFMGANLTGADFTGTTLVNTDFSDAVLDNTIFNE